MARGPTTVTQVMAMAVAYLFVVLPLKNTTFQLFGGNMGYMSVKD